MTSHSHTLNLVIYCLALYLILFGCGWKMKKWKALYFASVLFAGFWILYFLFCFFFQKNGITIGAFVLQFPRGGAKAFFYLDLALSIWIIKKEGREKPRALQLAISHRYGPFILLFIIGVLHRGSILLHIYPFLNKSISQYPLTIMQYLAAPALSDHFWMSLLYLQQTPPIPNMIAGLAIKIFGWPYETIYSLVFLQIGLSIATAMLLFSLLRKVTNRPSLSLILSIIFLVSTDLLVMEYVFNAEGFYENLSMLLVLLTVFFLERALHKQRVAAAAALGLTAGALALTRASFSYFFFVPALFLFLPLAPASKIKRNLLITYFACIFATQFAWSAKNAVIYRTLGVSATSWKGLNFAVGINKAGMGDELLRFILTDEAEYPSWFIALVKEKRFSFDWFNPPPEIQSYLPESIQRQDERIQAILHDTNRQTNSVGYRVISDMFMTACKRFYIEDPRTLLLKFQRSYDLFWQPFRYYVGIWVMGGTAPRAIPVNRFNIIETESYPLVLRMNFFIFHFLAPVILIGSIIGSLRKKRPMLPPTFFYISASLLYALVVMNLPEYGENMRFRLAAEPLIWLISIWSIKAALQFFSDRLFVPSADLDEAPDYLPSKKA